MPQVCIIQFKNTQFSNLYDAGVQITVSTDDPPYFHTDIDLEYNQLATKLNWSDTRLKEISRIAMNAAFCDNETKRKLLNKL